MEHKQHYILLVTIYLSVVILKLSLAHLILAPTITDELQYLWMAQALLYNQVNNYPPLYPLIISLFPSDNLQTTYNIAKYLNAFISSLIIFPVFFLSQVFLNKQLSIIISTFSLFIPISFTYSFLVMSENLFYPLFLTSVYLIFKSEKEDKKRLYITSGVVMTLVVLTRVIGLILIVSYALFLIYKLITYKRFNKFKFYSFIPFLGIYSIYLLSKSVFYTQLDFISSPFNYATHNIIDMLNILNSHLLDIRNRNNFRLVGIWRTM